MIDTKLKQITYHLTGLELKIDNRRKTALETFWNTKTNTIVNQYIGFNKKQIEHIKRQVFIRGYDIKNQNIKYIQILLHEIAHYKQMSRFTSPAIFNMAYRRRFFYFEAVADRYALRYYKRFI